MPRSKVCFMLAALVSAPGFLVATLAPGTLDRVVSIGAGIAWVVLDISLVLVGLAFWKLDDE